MTTSRRVAREAVLHCLYAAELGGLSPIDGWNEEAERLDLDDSVKAWASQLLVADARWDEHIGPLLKASWGLDRLPVVDLVILRLGCAELYTLPGVPPKVTLSEMVRLADRFSTSDSPRFVHGVLANVLKQSPKANWDPSQEEAWDDPEEPPIEVEVEEVEAGSEDYDRIQAEGPWVLRQPD